MEFLKERCFTALNADELKQGDKVIVAETLMGLRENVENNAPVCTIKEILGEDFAERFNVDIDWNRPLAYLVERAENCTNCDCFVCAERNWATELGNERIYTCEKYKPKTEQKAEKKCIDCKHYAADYCCKNHHVTMNDNKACADFDDTPVKKIDRKVYEYYNTKTEPHYRPFRDTDELLKEWEKKAGEWGDNLWMPYIWVRRKDSNCKGQLITKFSDPLWVIMSTEGYNMTDLFEHFTFLDGSPCGVEE